MKLENIFVSNFLFHILLKASIKFLISIFNSISGDSLHSTPLDRAYKSKVLGHYPDSVPWNLFDEHAVCMVGLFSIKKKFFTKHKQKNGLKNFSIL